MARRFRVSAAALFVSLLVITAGCNSGSSNAKGNFRSEATDQSSGTSKSKKQDTGSDGSDSSSSSGKGKNNKDGSDGSDASSSSSGGKKKGGTGDLTGYAKGACPVLAAWLSTFSADEAQLKDLTSSTSALGKDYVPVLDDMGSATDAARKSLDSLKAGDAADFNDALVGVLKDVTTQTGNISDEASVAGADTGTVIQDIDAFGTDFQTKFTALGDKFPDVNSALSADPTCTAAVSS
jgi:hypothetical protein